MTTAKKKQTPPIVLLDSTPRVPLRHSARYSSAVPIVSYFFGIYVRMYFDDHDPPHFHVEYQGHEAFVSIDTGEVLEGGLPTRAARLVREWCLEHQPELRANWEHGRALEPMARIPGADQ